MNIPLTTVCVLLSLLIAMCSANDNKTSSKPRGNKVRSLTLMLLYLLFSNCSQYKISILFFGGAGGRGGLLDFKQTKRLGKCCEKYFFYSRLKSW